MSEFAYLPVRLAVRRRREARSTLDIPSRNQCFITASEPVTIGAANEVPEIAVMELAPLFPGKIVPMLCPGAAKHQFLALPQRLEKSAMFPFRSTATADRTSPRSSEINAGRPAQSSSSSASTLLGVLTSPSSSRHQDRLTVHSLPLALPPAMTKTIRSSRFLPA